MSPNKKLKYDNSLESLKSMTTVVADSGDFQALKKFNPIDVTTNPSLILSAVSLPEYKPLIEKAINFGKKLGQTEDEILDSALDSLNVFVGAEILKLIPGRVSTEINAALSFNKDATVEKAKHIINLYKDCGVSKDRVLIKLASTWESIEAAKILEKKYGIHCNMTLLFSLTQAVACAEANVTLISPFVGRILDWHVKNGEKKSFEADKDPGVVSVKEIYQYYKHFGYNTVIMGASFRNIGEIKELAGCDLLTISPTLLMELEKSKDQLIRKLDADQAKDVVVDKIDITEDQFRWRLNQDEMATDKLAEGIHRLEVTSTISSPWTPVSVGASADTNGSNSDSKLDIGDLSDDERDLAAADAEGVWSPDIEQSFQEAMSLYPPCGRRKIILSDEGKMYGRNELIARYIKIRTGKTRTRKQVSSHIQVLARRKLREIQAKMKVDQMTKEKTLQTMSSMSSAQIVSATNSMHNNKAAVDLVSTLSPFKNPSSCNPNYMTSQFWQPALQAGTSQDVKSSFSQTGYPAVKASPVVSSTNELSSLQPSLPPPWEGRAIAASKLRLVEFTAFLETQDETEYQKHLFVHIGAPTTYTDPLLEAVDVKQIYDKFPEKKGGLKELYDKGPQMAFFLVKFWADLNSNIEDQSNVFYGVTSVYESSDNMTITCSTKVCSFGKQVVEKVETEYARFENGRFIYRINRSPMCDYMINFIRKLKNLPEKYMMNSVLENFTILQVVTNRETQETLLCTAYVFEVSASEHGAQHHIYKLVKE